MNYKYKIETKIQHQGNLEALINQYGANGWKLHMITEYYIIFERKA